MREWYWPVALLGSLLLYEDMVIMRMVQVMRTASGDALHYIPRKRDDVVRLVCTLEDYFVDVTVGTATDHVLCILRYSTRRSHQKACALQCPSDVLALARKNELLYYGLLNRQARKS